MTQLRARNEPETVTNSQTRLANDDRALLAAALAATLVEYRRAARQRNGQARAQPAGPNWRTMARLEQTRGQT
jgi:hypothetical protein